MLFDTSTAIDSPLTPFQLASLREAFGPESVYYRVNTAADTWTDWLDFLSREPTATLRDFAYMLVRHEFRQGQTSREHLVRRVARFLSCQCQDPDRGEPDDEALWLCS